MVIVKGSFVVILRLIELRHTKIIVGYSYSGLCDFIPCIFTMNLLGLFETSQISESFLFGLVVDFVILESFLVLVLVLVEDNRFWSIDSFLRIRGLHIHIFSC